MPGRPRKPVEQLQYRGDGREERRSLRVVAPGEARKMPACPRDLTGVGRVAWRAYWADPVSLAATGVDAYDIHRYCRLLARREALEEQVAAEPVVDGYAGPTVNPLHKLVRELTREIEKYREMLGILPLARMRLGLVQAQAAVTVGELRRQLARPRREEHEPRADERPVIDLEHLP